MYVKTTIKEEEVINAINKKYKTSFKVNQEIEIDAEIFKKRPVCRMSATITCVDCEKEYKKNYGNIKFGQASYCSSCKQKGGRSFWYGKPMHENTKKALTEYSKGDKNPFKNKEIQKKIKEKKPWKNAHKLNKGSKRTDSTRKKMSETRHELLKTGAVKIPPRWGKMYTKIYKEIKYQSTYELKFLKFLDDNDKLHLIERGPIVEYEFKNKKRLYYVDFKIKNTNIIFEIKSSYLLENYMEECTAKFNAAKKEYTFNLILNNNFNNVLCMIQDF